MPCRALRAVLSGCLAAGIAAGASSAAAMFLLPDEAPVERLAANVARHVAEHPDDPAGHYTLGRIHALAVALRTDTLRAYSADEPLPSLEHAFHEPAEKQIAAAAAREHLRKALPCFRRAIELAPENGLYRLGYASAIESGAGLADFPPPGAPERCGSADRTIYEALVRAVRESEGDARKEARETLARCGAAAAPVLAEHVGDDDAAVRETARELLDALWREAAVPVYLRAHELTVGADRKLEHAPLEGLERLVSHEAGRAWLRLVRARGVREDERAKVAEVEQGIAAVEALPPGPVTPIVFPLDRPRPLASLLDPARVVEFDLDGDRRPEPRPWLRPDTGLLVWDPRGEGDVDSGRRLFGSVTWWIFWRDGYAAMAALDDDGDGWLRGEELAGLAVWRDADQDGRSIPAEVEPLGALGVEALAVRATTTEAGCPAHPSGLRLRGGRTLPTYDWVPGPAPRGTPSE